MHVLEHVCIRTQTRPRLLITDMDAPVTDMDAPVLQEPFFEDFGYSTMHLLRHFLGLIPAQNYEVDWLGMLLLVVFSIILHVGLLSILIAQLALAYEHLSADKAGYAKMNRAFVCVEVESIMSMAQRKKIWDSMGFFSPLQFDHGDEGPAGGVQVRENAVVRADPKYVPDRIIRCTGKASPNDPWPRIMTAEEVAEGKS